MNVNQSADKEFTRYFAPLLLPIESGQEDVTLLKLRVMVETMSLEARPGPTFLWEGTLKGGASGGP